jgi:hypothetical protein
MAGAEPLDRIGALAAGLAPLGAMQRGMPIEADDWNVLVATLQGILELDRGQFDALRGALADAYAPTVHEHLGTVSVAWLASDLQARVGDGASAVSLLSAIADLRRQVDAERQEVARLTAVVEDLQRRIDRSSVDNLDRGTRLHRFEDRLTGVEDLKVTVGAMTGTVQSLRPGIEQVLQLKASLTDPNGNPVDVAGLQGQIQDLQGMRDLFTGINGEVVHIKDIETRIADLKDVVDHATPGGLEQRFGALSTDLQGRVDSAIAQQGDTLRGELDQRLQANQDASTEQVRVALDAASVKIDETLTARVGEAETRLSATLDARDQQLTANIRNDVLAASQAQVDAGLATIPGIVDSRITVSENRLGNVIDQRLNDRFGHVILPHPAPPAEAPKRANASKTAKAPKTAEARKTAETPKTAEAPKMAEAPTPRRGRRRATPPGNG